MYQTWNLQSQWSINVFWVHGIMPKSLFKSIESLFKFAHIKRMIFINKARALSHVNNFIEMALKKGIVTIQFTKQPTIW